MQDNWTDEQFMDLAWEQMRQTLDVEMPQEKRRRALIWWWLGGLSLLFVLPATNRFTWSKNKQEVLSTPNLKKEAAEKKAISPLAANTFSNTKKVPLSSVDQHPKTELIIAPTAAKAKLQQSYLAAKKIKQPTQNAHFSNVSSDFDQLKLVSSRKAENLSPQTPSVDLNKNNPLLLTNHPLDSALQAKPMLGLDLIALPALQTELERPINPEHLSIQEHARQDSRLHLWADAAFMASNLSSGPSGNSSLLLGKSFGKWSLLTGVGYQLANLNLQAAQSGKQFSLAIRTLGVSSGKGADTSLVQAYSSAAIEIRTLFVPLLLQRKLGQHWQIEGGVIFQQHLAYLRQKNLPLLSVSTNPFSADKSIEAKQSYSSFAGSKGTALNPDLTSRWGWSVQLGASYQFSPRWYVRIAVQSAFADLIKSDVYRLKPQFLQLGLRYQIR
jgi:hypothetical protein